MPFTNQVWKASIGVLGFSIPPTQWDDLLHWLNSVSLNQTQFAAVLQIWHGCIYTIWYERNARFHNGLSKAHWMLSRDVIKQAREKSAALRSGGSELGSSLVAFWSMVQ
ncbi:hypothetical protein N665_2277s0008 [Sinapis alba]|nr:hypothetical protein N665_2277s0008 [Sinapis alba]